MLRPADFASLLSSNYLPHRFCYLAEPWLVWSNAVTDSLIAISYAVIFCCLAKLLLELRRVAELRSYLWVIASFGLFILACGMTHLMDVVTVWVPVYPLSALFKVICAFISVPTAIVFAQRTPTISSKFGGYLDLVSAERQESIEALRKTKNLLDRTGRLAGVGGWELDIDTRRLTWSAEMFHIFGFRPEGQPSLEESLAFYKPDSRASLLAALHRSRTETAGWSLELEAQRLDGRHIWIRCVAAVEVGPNGHMRVIGASQDITADVERRQKLRKTEAFLDRTGRLAAVGGWQIEVSTRTVTLSEETSRILGLPQGYTPSLEEAFEMCSPETRQVVGAAVERCLLEGEGWDVEVLVTRRDGESVWVRVIGEAEMVDGKPMRLTGAIQNISARVARQEVLRRANEGISLATDSGRVGIWNRDLLSGVLTWNAWAFRLFGLEPGSIEPSFELWISLLHPDDAEAALHAVAQTVAQGTLLDLEYRVIWPDGSIHHIHAAGRVSRDSDGRAINMIGANLDVSGQRELENERERLMTLELRLRDDFLSHVSHELRSPLASIYSFSSLMADGLAGATTAEQDEYLGIVLKNTVQLQAMIEDLLHVTQSRQTILSVEPRCVSLSEAIQECVQTLQWAAAAKDVVIDCQGCDELPEVFADPTRLRQILIILLNNAVKFTPMGGRVDISVLTRRADALLVQVSDTGCGIPQADLVRVFERLHQIGATDTAGRSGLGLGLHIARDLVSRQGGRVWVTSEVGVGSVFSFTIPTHLGHCAELHTEPGLRNRRRLIET